MLWALSCLLKYQQAWCCLCEKTVPEQPEQRDPHCFPSEVSTNKSWRCLLGSSKFIPSSYSWWSTIKTLSRHVSPRKKIVNYEEPRQLCSYCWRPPNWWRLPSHLRPVPKQRWQILSHLKNGLDESGRCESDGQNWPCPLSLTFLYASIWHPPRYSPISSANSEEGGIGILPFSNWR
jgi:hypothetical protein